MAIFALADLHLSLSLPDKDMAVFGPAWHDYTNRIESNWREAVHEDDLVLIAGDICWASRLDEAIIDLKWIDALPGTKVLIKGNHDYWWASKSKVAALALPSMHFIQHDAFNWKGVSISGTRLWDSPEYSFGDYIERRENPKEKVATPRDVHEDAKIFKRELQRLELACQSLDPSAASRIVMTHYPPIGGDLKASEASKILEAHRIDICLFGHLHNIPPTTPLFGVRNGVRYLLTSADYLRFIPIQIA